MMPTVLSRSTSPARVLIAALVLLPLPAAPSPAAGVERPNLVLILADDLGKEWISCYGAEGIETPRIDRLAEEGMRFRNAYSMPQCTPTRVTLLTGQYPFRHGWTNHWDVPRWGSGCHFDPDRNASFPRRLRDAGYATAIAGKWQIDDFRVEPGALDEAGFDDWCVWTGGEGGNPESHARYWDPYIHTREGSRTHEDRFGPDVFNDFLIEFARRHRDEPMLLYYPLCLTHAPFVATPEEPRAKGRKARYAAMVRYTDTLVGRLVDALDGLGLRERTVIVFTTDNGSPRGLRGRRHGRRVRGAKARMNEAGVAMPFIVRGPGRVPRGVTTDALTDLTDLLPTFTELAGTGPSEKWAVDGRSIAPLLLGETGDSPRRWIYAQGGHPAAFRDGRVVPARDYDDRVIRDERWKLWVGTDREPARLYDLREDPREEENLIESEDPAAVAARKRLAGVIARLPARDAAPRYAPNPPQPWDKADYEGPAPAKR